MTERALPTLSLAVGGAVGSILYLYIEGGSWGPIQTAFVIGVVAGGLLRR